MQPDTTWLAWLKFQQELKTVSKFGDVIAGLQCQAMCGVLNRPSTKVLFFFFKGSVDSENPLF